MDSIQRSLTANRKILSSQMGQQASTKLEEWVQIFTGGRVSGDVKNFWSSRQKRLARILHHHQSPNHTKSTSSFLVSKMLLQRARSHQQSLNLVHCLINNNNYDPIKMVPLPDLVINPSPQEVPQPQLDITFSPGSQELLARFEDPYFFDVFRPVDVLLLSLLLLISSRF
ncbi:hypothetical protein LWI29_038507 [Acer saccharum]|uniref:Uncharacterized protein n=1 Tax=Acer saccharum TaxID=4024 RepID=A0AA39S7D2_ACESA|nr:hypothetical protein LWI29_038507 [Acer saccharum]